MTYRSEQENAFARASAAYDELLAFYVKRGWVLGLDCPVRDMPNDLLIDYAGCLSAALKVLSVPESPASVQRDDVETAQHEWDAALARWTAVAQAARDVELALGREPAERHEALERLLRDPPRSPTSRSVDAIAEAAEAANLSADAVLEQLHAALGLETVKLAQVDGWRFECTSGGRTFPPFAYLAFLVLALNFARSRTWIAVSVIAAVCAFAIAMIRRRPVKLSLDAAGIVVEKAASRRVVPLTNLRGLTMEHRPVPRRFVEPRLLVVEADGTRHVWSCIETAPGTPARLRAWTAEVRRRAEALGVAL